MIRLLAIDPGSERSGFVEYDPTPWCLPGQGRIIEHGIVDNQILLARCWRERDPVFKHHLAIELVNVFGHAGATVYRTCIWHGRFVEAWGAKDYTEVTRNDIKIHLWDLWRRPGLIHLGRRHGSSRAAAVRRDRDPSRLGWIRIRLDPRRV